MQLAVLSCQTQALVVRLCLVSLYFFKVYNRYKYVAVDIGKYALHVRTLKIHSFKNLDPNYFLLLKKNCFIMNKYANFYQ